MADNKIERSTCRFTVELANGKPFLAIQLYQGAILGGAEIGFELLGGMRINDAKKLADTLNEHILEIFVATDKTVNPT